MLKEVKAGKRLRRARQAALAGSGQRAANGGDLGFFQQGQMVGPFNDVGVHAGAGAVSDLVETQFGFHIIKVAEKQAARAVPLDEVRPQLEQYPRAPESRSSRRRPSSTALKTKGKVEILI